MTPDEIVKALRETDIGCGSCSGLNYKSCGADCSDRAILAAADLIEALQSQLAASQRREQAAVNSLGEKMGVKN